MNHARLAPVLAVAAMGLSMQAGSGDGGHAYQQIMASPASDLRIPKRKKNVNRPKKARKR